MKKTSKSSVFIVEMILFSIKGRNPSEINCGDNVRGTTTNQPTITQAFGQNKPLDPKNERSSSQFFSRES